MGHELPMVSAFRQSAYKLGLDRTPGSLSGKSTQVVKRHSIHNQKKILNKELRQVFHHMIHPNEPYSIINLLEQNSALHVSSYLGFEDIILFERASKQLMQSIRKYYNGVIICQASQMLNVRRIYPQATLRHICDNQNQIALCKDNGIPIPNLLNRGATRQIVDVTSKNQIFRAIIEHNHNEYEVIGSRECPIIFENGWVKKCQIFHVREPKYDMTYIGDKSVPVKFNGNNMPTSCKELQIINKNKGDQRIYFGGKAIPIKLSGDSPNRLIYYEAKKELIVKDGPPPLFNCK